MDAQADGRIVLLYSGYVIHPGDRDHEYQAGWNRDLFGVGDSNGLEPWEVFQE